MRSAWRSVMRVNMRPMAARSRPGRSTPPASIAESESRSDAVLDAMPAHGVFINIARGPVVNEAEMIDRLQRKVIAGAALDTFIEEPLSPDSPLWSMKNVIITPHIGGKSESYVDQILPLLAHNILAFEAGKLDDFRNLVAR